MYDILPKNIGVSRIYYILTEQHTVTQPRMEAANVTTDAMAKNERSTYRRVEIDWKTSLVSVPIYNKQR